MHAYHSRNYKPLKSSTTAIYFRHTIMEQGYVYLNELNNNSKNYSVKVRIAEKSRPKTSSKKGILFQTLLLTDEKGNKMKGALFGEQVDSFNEAIVYNGQYIISNAPIKLVEERWRHNSDELPFQMTFGGQTVVQKVNCEGTIDGPLFQSIQSIPRILTPGTKYDVLGIVLYVEDKVRIINVNQGREFHVKEIVITDQTIDQPLVINTWNDLADNACDAISLYAKTFDVIGFTALRPSVHKGFSLSTGMSTEIIYDPKGDKSNILREWARFHTQQILDRQAKVLQVRGAPTDATPIDIQSLRTKKPCDVLQEERHWLRVTISQADLKDVVAYIGCSACGKRIDIPVGIEFSCANCKKKDSISAHRATFKFDATDDSGTMTFTTFTTDIEKLFGISAHEIHLIKHSENVQMFNSIQQQICDSHILVQVGPTTALSRNNVLQWCLKGIKVEVSNTKEDNNNCIVVSSPVAQHHNAEDINADNLSSSQNELRPIPQSLTTSSENVNTTRSEATDDMVAVNSLLELSQQPSKQRYTEALITKVKSVEKDRNPTILGDFAETGSTVQGHLPFDVNTELKFSSDKLVPLINKKVVTSSDLVETFGVSMNQERGITKSTEVISTKTTPKKRSLTALFAATEAIDTAQRNDSETNNQL